MTVSVMLDFRFRGAPDGSVWTKTSYANAFWQRYRAVFDEVNVVARVEPRPIPPGWQRVDGAGVRVSRVPYYLGPMQYLARLRAVRSAVRSQLRPGQAVVIRAPGQLANVSFSNLARTGYPYGLEVGGDPHEAFGRGAVRHPLRPLFRFWFTAALKQQCRRAQAVAYVTESVLQRRYPCARYSISASDVEISGEALSLSPKVFITSYSNVELRDDAFVNSRPTLAAGRMATLVFVGSLSQMYKGPDILIRAAAGCIRRRLDLRLVLIGDGKHRAGLEDYARAHGIGARVRFLGELAAGEAVRAELDQADLFVLPSRTEGLPRAMVEAMARGLPCIGTAVGGIVELLPPEDLVPPGDAAALAATIETCLRDPARLQRMSRRNLAKAREYREEVLCERRIAFYRHLKEQTQAWIEERRGAP